MLENTKTSILLCFIAANDYYLSLGLFCFKQLQHAKQHCSLPSSFFLLESFSSLVVWYVLFSPRPHRFFSLRHLLLCLCHLPPTSFLSKIAAMVLRHPSLSLPLHRRPFRRYPLQLLSLRLPSPPLRPLHPLPPSPLPSCRRLSIGSGCRLS